jgi:hypothetical protein
MTLAEHAWVSADTQAAEQQGDTARLAHSLSNFSQLRAQEEPPFVRTPAGQASAAVYFVDSLPAQVCAACCQ